MLVLACYKHLVCTKYPSLNLTMRKCQFAPNMQLQNADVKFICGFLSFKFVAHRSPGKEFKFGYFIQT